jgi:hypothetical protein
MDGKLVERMCEAAFEVFSGTTWGEAYKSTRDDFRRGMAAAAKVCIDEALGEPTDDEWIAVVGRGYENIPLPEALRKIRRLVQLRKARLLAPKIAESRVTIEPCPRDSWKVLLDGKFHFGGNGIAKCDAEIYRDGLILKLKEQHS